MMIESSTPLHSDLRRRTLITNMMNDNTPSSPLRKSLCVSLANSTLTELTNDDEERADRRSQLRIQKRLSDISTPKSVLNESFIKEQLVVYTHLYTENKITVKNAWKLQIIDMLRPLCQKTRPNVLQIASTTIDISAKVYGIRVDDCYSDGLKLATNMARTSAKGPAEENDNDDESDKEDEAGGRAGRRKKKKRSHLTGIKSTIAKNSSANIGKLPKLEPTDFSTRFKSDTGTVDNLFTNILNQTASSFILMDKSHQLVGKIDTVVQDSGTKSLRNIPLSEKLSKINAPFSEFRIDQWDPDLEEKQLNGERSLPLADLQPVVFDEQGFPMHDLDGSIPDATVNNYDNNDNADMDNDHEGEEVVRLAPGIRAPIEHVVDFRPMESSVMNSEYSFNSMIVNNGKYIDQIWAGPSHWKLKCLRQASKRFSGQRTVLVPRTKKKNEAEPIDFDQDPPEIDFAQKLIIRKKAPTIDIDKITLPLMDQSCVRLMDNIRELILKPGVCPVEKKDTPPNDQEDYEVPAYNYENPNDSMYCSQSQPDDGDGDVDMEVDEQILSQDGNFAENLVDNPEMVPSTYMKYALKAKQMDMKKLKAAIWHKLTGMTVTMAQPKVITQKFSDLYKSLPDALGGKEKSELSCPLAFVALLHLCNEQNLQLLQHPGYKDFEIMGPSA